MIWHRRAALHLIKQLLALLLVSMLMACGNGQPEQGRQQEAEDRAPAPPVRAPEPLPTELTPDALAMQEQILSVTGRDSLRRFAELAEQAPDFASNFDGIAHFEHWSLLRRTGVDPLRNIEELFALPFGARQVGAEVWFIWPDFAATDPGELVPEKLSFRDRARLLEILGEEGLARLRASGVYPGLRTAISDSGRWVYYVNDIGQSETSSNE